MEIIIILILILLNGVFSMSEIALVSSRKNRLETNAKRGSKSARTALELANSPNKFLSTVQIGITLIGILTGIFSGEKMTTDIQHAVERIHFLQPYASGIAVAIVVILITYLTLIFGELVPKRIGLANPERIATTMARPMKLISLVTAPFVWLLSKTSDIIIKLLNIRASSDNRVTEEEIKAIVEEGTQSGEVQQIEQEIVERVFSLGDRKVSSLMTYRRDITAIDVGDDPDEIIRKITADLHSVYPVMDGEDNITGVVLLKDMFGRIHLPEFNLQQHIKSPNYIHENAPAYQVLEQFKTTREHYGIVIDEYGQVQGILTLNDLLESLVGGFSKLGSDAYTIHPRPDGSYIIDGQLPFHDFLDYFDLNDLSAEFSYNTMGGLVLDRLERIPSEGDTITWHSFTIEVIDMDGARIDKVLVRKQA